MSSAQESVRDLQTTMNELGVSQGQQMAFDDVNAHIDQYYEDPETHHHTLRERLELALTEFGAEHPSLSQKLQVAISDLSNAGV